jgi:hypothetical protein
MQNYLLDLQCESGGKPFDLLSWNGPCQLYGFVSKSDPA